MQKVALVNSTTDILKKHRLRDRTERIWFSRLLQNPARKRSKSILTIPEPAQGCAPELGNDIDVDNSTYLLILTPPYYSQNTVSASLRALFSLY